MNYTPVAKVANLGQTIDELKEKGIYAIAPTNETTLDILYQGVHQCYLSYGKDLPSHEPGGGGGSSASSTVSSSATSESASTAASEEVAVMESPSNSVDREASASR